jgi:chitinase
MGGTESGAGSGGGGSGGSPQAPTSFVLSPYKDTSINLDWNTNVVSTKVSGTLLPFATDLAAHGGKTVTLAFATGECGAENWAGVTGAALASANVSRLVAAGIRYIVSTGGAGGVFTCSNDTGFETMLARWNSPNLIGVDFDIEGGQTANQVDDLVVRIGASHVAHPDLRFSLTLATLASNAGTTTAQSLGTAAPDDLNVYGREALSALKSKLGFTGASSTWPTYVTINLMTMDYGSPSKGVCVVGSGGCDMGQSAMQAAYNLHDKWAVPYENIELTPMIGGNDTSGEAFTLPNADTVKSFAASRRLAGVHYWSYDRDIDCAMGSASPTCNTMGSGYAGPYGYLQRFVQ